jgi:hypothetical protein
MNKPEAEYIITFNNASQAIKAEKSLLAQQIKVGVLPLPSQISAGCGICLRIGKDEIRQALAILTDVQVNEIGLFSRAMENGRYAYSELEELEKKGVL